MKVLITGADGQLGRCLQDRFGLLEHEVRPVSRSELDITDANAVSGCVLAFRPDVIINAAAFTAVDKAESEASQAWAVNAEAVEHLAEAADKVGALLIQVSTDYVFDGEATRPYTEDDPENPTGVYGSSKFAGEQAASKALRHVIVRTAWVFSEYGHNFLKTMLRLGAERDSLSIVNDQVGTPTYAGDLAEALVQICEQPPANGVYHFCGGESCTWFDFACRIFETRGQVLSSFRPPEVKPIASAEFPTPAKRPAYSVLDGEKLQRETGINSGNWQEAVAAVCKRLQ